MHPSAPTSQSVVIVVSVYSLLGSKEFLLFLFPSVDNWLPIVVADSLPRKVQPTDRITIHAYDLRKHHTLAKLLRRDISW